MYRTYYSKEEGLWRGVDSPPLYNPNASIGQLVLRKLRVHGKRVAQINHDTGITQTFDELRTKSIRAAQNLQSRGYKKGQVFGFIASNTDHIAPVVFASLYLGCPLNTMDPSFARTEIKHMLSITTPTAMFCDVKIYDVVKECLTGLGNDAHIFTFGGRSGDSEPVESLFEAVGSELDFVPTNVDGEKDLAFIVCSSGTTGLSKGVCLSHAAFGDVLTRFDLMSADDVLLCYSSLYWLSGVYFLIGGTVAGALRPITTQFPLTALQFDMIRKYKVTYMMCSPYQVAMMAKSDLLATADLSSVRYYVTGGGRVSSDVIATVNRCLPNGKVYMAYGLSETGGIGAADFPEPSVADTVGRLVSGVVAKIVDENGNRCGVGEDGELCLKTGHRIAGYYKNQKANDELFDSDGFLRTGDVAHFDADGNLFIVDRKREMLKWRGCQVAPSHLEAQLMKSPLIRMACVVGIPHEVDGDLLAACVIRNAGAALDEKQVYDMIGDDFADYCKLRGGVFFVDALPFTASGKLVRRKVRDIATELYYKRRHA